MQLKKIALTACLLGILTGCGSAPASLPAAEVTAEAPQEERVLHIAVADIDCIPQEVTAATKLFNTLDNGCTAEVISYNKQPDGGSVLQPADLQVADLQLQMDIIQGKNVDIVIDAAFSDMSRYEILAEKGAFTDLYPLLDGDSGTDRAELDGHILSLHENDGHLYQMPSQYMITTLCGRSRYVGTKENWTFDEMAARWAEMPPGARFSDQNGRIYVYHDVVRANLGAFVDYGSGTCSFDSPEFIRLLEFCTGFPPDADKYDPDADTVCFLQKMSLGGFDNFHTELAYAGEDITFVGYPSEDGCGNFLNATGFRYSICAGSKLQAEAWDFLSLMLTEDVQAGCYDFCFPVNTAAFDRLAQAELSRAGEERIRSFNGVEKDIGYLEQAEYDRLCALIGSLRRIDHTVDRSAQTLIEKDAQRLFDGECTAEDCAKSIQGRMQLLISERS